MPSQAISALLELLVEQAGCVYLSDLHAGHYAGRICGAVDGISDDQFPVHAWDGVICYITGQPAAFPTAADAKAFLTAFLSQPPEQP